MRVYSPRISHNDRLVVVVFLTIAILSTSFSARADIDAAAEALDSGNYLHAAREIRGPADAGNPLAQAILAGFYRDGIGVAKNLKQAYEWYFKAAQQGFVSAQINLALMNRDALGRPADLIAAYMWFSIAGRQNPVAAADLKRLANSMTASDIKQGREAALAWLAKHVRK